MRFHLFEFTDLKWYPGFLKKPIQEYLDFESRRFGIFEPAIPIIEEGLRESGHSLILDLGSGAGGGLVDLWQELCERHPDLLIQQSDLFPIYDERPSESSRVQYLEEPVDAGFVPERLKGFRTLFTLAHHFQPDQLRAVIADAARKRTGLAIFEPVGGGIIQILLMILLVPWLVLFTVPFIRPFKLSRLLFTFLLPIIPATIVWDGVVSSLRAYNEEELLRIAREAQRETGASIRWQSGTVFNGRRMPLLYLMGTPIQTVD